MACCARLRPSCRGSARSQHCSVIWRGVRPFCGSARLATLAPWLPLKNRGDGACRPTRHSTISMTMWPRPLVLAVDGRSASVTLTVTDNWPEDVPVTEAEIAVFEAWFGELFDSLHPGAAPPDESLLCAARLGDRRRLC